MSRNVTDVPFERNTPNFTDSSTKNPNSIFKRLKIGHRIYFGFGLLLVLLTALSISSFSSMTDVEQKFVQFEEMSGDSLLVSDVRQGVDAIQKEARSYFSGQDDKAKELYATEYQLLEKTIDTLLARVEGKTEVKKVIQSIDDQLELYHEGFTKIVGLMEKQDALYDKKLVPSSNMLQNWLADIRETASLTGNVVAANTAGDMQEKLMAARLDITGFRYSHDSKLITIAKIKLKAMLSKLKELDKAIKNPELRGELEMVQKVAPDYRKDFESLQATVTEIQTLNKEVLDAEAKKISDTSTQIRTLAQRDQSALSNEAKMAMGTAENTLIIVGGLALLLGIIAAALISRGITKPVIQLTSSMTSLAEGDLTCEIEGSERGDELGEMANALGIFKQNAIRTKELEADQERQKQLAEQEKHALMVQMADDFDSHVGVIVEAVSNASGQLHTTAQSMSDVSDVTASQATAASAASEQTSSNVQTVASATEEMTNTIAEISEQVGMAAQSAQEAVGKVNDTNTQMQLLTETANKIDEVVELISGIAEQTNLLALNATIEAARAGDAGKGFAIVAGEVKALAGQTAKATSDISHQISAIQSATNRASSSMDDVNCVIMQVNEISTAIAAAMEEQNAATHEIANSITQAAQGTQLVNDNVAAVTEATAKTGVASGEVIEAAVDLQSQAGTLKKEVAKFITQVRAS